MIAVRALAWLLVLATPLAGVWLAGALAAMLHGPRWLPWLAGALVFPVLPLAWDLLARRLGGGSGGGGSFFDDLDARRRRSRTGLGFADRLLVRTLGLSVVFLGVVGGWWRGEAATAVQVRGDWMVDGVEADWMSGVREALVGLGDRVAALDGEDENPYADLGETPPPPQQVDLPEPVTLVLEEGRAEPGETEPIVVDQGVTVPLDEAEPALDQGAATDEGLPDRSDPGYLEAVVLRDLERAGHTAGTVRTVTSSGKRGLWPLERRPHRRVRDAPRESPEALGRWARQVEVDEVKRLKLLHDVVVTRIAYDVPALDPAKRGTQSAESVWAKGAGVCAGYANVMVAAGTAAGLEVVYVLGDSRETDGSLSPSGHAWNAAKLEGRWYLLDATWNAGHVTDGRFTAEYGADYLLTPPELFAATHRPDDDRWQLMKRVMSEGEFVRRPMLRPSFAAAGLALKSPTRSQVDVAGELVLEIDNPMGHELVLEYGPSGQRTRCTVAGERVTCPFPERGRHELLFFHREGGESIFDGRLHVNAR